MNNSQGDRATGTPEAPAVVLSLKTVHNMLPLVQRILDDVQVVQRSLERLQPEQIRLERQKRNLDWPSRQRRYQLQDEIAATERRLQEAKDELASLGVALLDADTARVGFPTMVNNRRAYFSWRPGEDGLHSWHFAEESLCRPIPAAWLKELSFSGK
jgi:hypothetical protein